MLLTLELTGDDSQTATRTWSCDREVQDASDSEEPPADQPALPARDQP